jgi:membrane protease YdiL (CAAX protease family)
MLSLGLLAAGLAAAAGYQIVARRSRPADRFRGASPLILFALQVVLVSIAGALLLILGVPLEGTGLAFLTVAVVLLAAYGLVVWLWGFRSGALSARDVGWPVGARWTRWPADVGVGAGLFVLVAIAASLWGAIVALLLDTTSPEVVPIPTGPDDILFVVLGACVLIPIGEELFFRGYSLTAWLRDLGPVSALVRSTLFFTLVHIANIDVAATPEGAVIGLKQAILTIVVLAPVGYALGWIFLRRGLVAAIAGHAAFNLYGVLGLLLAESLPAR